NVLPLIFLAGMMGSFGILIDDNLVILLNVVLGIAVDDTIHFVTVFQDRWRLASGDFLNVLDETLTDTSPALIGMTLNFLVTVPAFALMNLVLFKQIAVFLWVVLALALLFDFFLMPLMLP